MDATGDALVNEWRESDWLADMSRSVPIAVDSASVLPSP
jgi:hypothetical protein